MLPRDGVAQAKLARPHAIGMSDRRAHARMKTCGGIGSR